jgi:peptidyl-prolyl cis-trans isomerase A (cyclophilin A)
MKKRNTFGAIAMSLMMTASIFAQKNENKNLENGIYAQFNTSKGEILVKLEEEKTPMTVANFVGLAEGNFTFPKGASFKKPYYDGIKFHRVIANFMIQGGDPQGNGTGGPNYQFFDEIHPDLKHDKPGILSMANSGPATNGSQFFITHKDTPWLDGKHTVFGHVVKGQEVVDAIQQDDKMETVKIIRVGKAAEKFDATKVFNEVYSQIAEKQRKEKEEFDKVAKMTPDEYKDYMYKEVVKTNPKAKLSDSGLVYIIENEGSGDAITAGSAVSIHYRGTFRKDGKQFDSSYDRNMPMDFQYKVQRMIPGFEEGISMLKKGGKARLIIPYYQAYGATGRPGAIPPYSDLVFDIEIVNASPAPADFHDHSDPNHKH